MDSINLDLKLKKLKENLKDFSTKLIFVIAFIYFFIVFLIGVSVTYRLEPFYSCAGAAAILYTVFKLRLLK